MLTPNQQITLDAAAESCGDWRDLTDHDRDMFGRETLPDLIALVRGLAKRRAVVCKTCSGGGSFVVIGQTGSRPFNHLIPRGICEACNGTGATMEDGE